MKKTLLCVAAACSTFAAFAAPTQLIENQYAVTKQVQFSDLQFADVAELQASDAYDQEVIYDQPEGKLVYYQEFGRGLYWDPLPVAGETFNTGRIVYADDNVVYLQNASSSYKKGGWVKGLLSDDGKHILVIYPQKIDMVKKTLDDGTIIYIPLYASVMRADYTARTYYEVSANENEVTYTIDDNGAITMDGSQEFEYIIDPADGVEKVKNPEIMLTTYVVHEDGKKEWMFYGDCAQTLTPYSNPVVNEVPDDLEWQFWEMRRSGQAKRVFNIAFHGDEIYMKGLSNYMPDAVVKGSWDGKKAVFPSGQFLGYCEELYQCFKFYGCKLGWATDPSTGKDVPTFELADNVTIEYDSETNTFDTYSDEAFAFSVFENKAIILGESQCVSGHFYQRSVEELSAAPVNPEFDGYQRYDAEGWDYFKWILPRTNANDVLIDLDKMFYHLYINNELYTFYPDEFPSLTEETTDMPYRFNDGEGIFFLTSMPHVHYFLLNGMGTKSIGMVVYYNAPDGNRYNSDLVTYDVESGQTIVTGIGDAIIDNQPVSEQYYNLQGIPVANPSAGNIYIRSTTLSDGTKKASKFIAR